MSVPDATGFSGNDESPSSTSIVYAVCQWRANQQEMLDTIKTDIDRLLDRRCTGVFTISVSVVQPNGLRAVPVYINPLLPPGTLQRRLKDTPREHMVADSMETVNRDAESTGGVCC